MTRACSTRITILAQKSPCISFSICYNQFIATQQLGENIMENNYEYTRNQTVQSVRDAVYAAAQENAYDALDEARGAAWAAARSAVEDQDYTPAVKAPQELQHALNYARNGERLPRCVLIDRIRRFLGVGS
jgi:hypothetical protein